MKAHPFAEIFPLMGEDELVALSADIKANGLIEPITRYQGRILDGRNRELACRRARVSPRYRDFKGKDPRAFALSANLKRRHLNESQRALVADKLATLEIGVNQHTPIGAPSQAEAAEMLGVGRMTVQRARVVREHGTPELYKVVEQGKFAVSKAAALTKESKAIQNKVAKAVMSGEKPTEAVRKARREVLPEKVARLPDGKYRVIYADPPWQYSDARQTGDHRQSTGALDHYSTMSLDELCALKIKELAAPDCVFLCWATSPMLPDALEFVTSQGFKYKTFFVWDKGHGAFGSYHDAEAELLLVATRGSCTPDAESKVKQIQRFARSKHSAKPEEWRALIDKLWSAGPRVELFRRGDVPKGWKTWGAEANAAMIR